MKKKEYKSVYLYELDSVRKSRNQINQGQIKLISEIAKGNIVVLSYNQLSDSIAFLTGLENNSTFNAYKKLFELGRIQVSQFRGIRTPAEYILKNIEKDEDFIISFKCLFVPFLLNICLSKLYGNIIRAL